MLDRPFYQPAIAFLTVLALAGGVAVLLTSSGGPGIEIVPAEHRVEMVAGSPPTDTDSTALININTANADELDEALPGIGPTLSQRIVAYRHQNGPFERTDQLMLVNGIGQGTYDNLRSLVTVGN
jgi:competence ComEA-like helix-hairpin-helix protein